MAWKQFPVAPRNDYPTTSSKRQQRFQKSKVISVHSHFQYISRGLQWKKKNHVNHESSVLLHLLYYSCLFNKVLFFSFSSKEQSEAILITELKLKHDELPQGTLRKEGRRPARVCVMMQQHQVSNVSHFSVLFPRRDRSHTSRFAFALPPHPFCTVAA